MVCWSFPFHTGLNRVETACSLSGEISKIQTKMLFHVKIAGTKSSHIAMTILVYSTGGGCLAVLVQGCAHQKCFN